MKGEIEENGFVFVDGEENNVFGWREKIGVCT